jgi:hypothetical protein
MACVARPLWHGRSPHALLSLQLIPPYFGFQRHSGLGWTCCWFDPDANDPKPTFVDLKQGEAAARALNVSSHFVDPLRKPKRGVNFELADGTFPTGEFRCATTAFTASITA